jgi:hypothetical protein
MKDTSKPSCFGRIFEQEKLNLFAGNASIKKEDCTICAWFFKCASVKPKINADELKELEEIAIKRGKLKEEATK